MNLNHVVFFILNGKSHSILWSHLIFCDNLGPEVGEHSKSETAIQKGSLKGEHNDKEQHRPSALLHAVFFHGSSTRGPPIPDSPPAEQQNQ